MPPVIAVVIPMLDAANNIEVLLASLLHQRFDREWELVAVDNGSSDGTTAVVRSVLGASAPANLVRWKVVDASPRGYATPRNVGVQHSTAPLLAFCDADGAVDAGWLQSVVSALAQHPLVASRKYRATDVVARDPDLVWSEQRELESLLGFAFAPTAGLGCTRELFDAIGGFDTHFDLGGEDVDFSVRARVELGIEPVLEPAAVYWTKVPQRPRAQVRKGFRDGRSHVRLYERHRGHHHERASGPSTLLRALLPLARRLATWPRSSERRRSVTAWQLGSLAGRAVWSMRLRVRDF